MSTTEEKEAQILDQKYKWMELNIIWWVWSLWCSFTTIAINHPYIGLIGTSNCGSGLDLQGGHFSSSHLGECDFKKIPRDTGNKIKKQANQIFHHLKHLTLKEKEEEFILT